MNVAKLGIIIGAFFGVLFLIFNSSNGLQNQEIEITVGEEYLFSFDWDEENPFEKEIDTAKVLEIKDGYVKWNYRWSREGQFQSHEIKYFKHLIRKL